MLRLIRQDGYDRENLLILMRQILDDFPRLAAPSDRFSRLLLKPNFVMPAARSDASTTHPEFYMALAIVLQERGFTVGIGESPAIGSCKKALQAHGVLHECRDRGIDVVEFNQSVAFHGVPGDRSYSKLTRAAELDAWDGLVNVPKLKTHQQFTFTAASKNLYGCVTGKRKFVRHNLCANDPVRFARMIIANATELDCVAHIGDGITAMHVKGPRGGEDYDLGYVITSDSFLDHDWLFCRLIGLDPLETPLFAALDPAQHAALADRCDAIVHSPGFRVAMNFRHAPLIHISFSPWHVARSGLRTLRYSLSNH